jgi:hypothetical protein
MKDYFTPIKLMLIKRCPRVYLDTPRKPEYLISIIFTLYVGI